MDYSQPSWQDTDDLATHHDMTTESRDTREDENSDFVVALLQGRGKCNSLLRMLTRISGSGVEVGIAAVSKATGQVSLGRERFRC